LQQVYTGCSVPVVRLEACMLSAGRYLLSRDGLCHEETGRKSCRFARLRSCIGNFTDYIPATFIGRSAAFPPNCRSSSMFVTPAYAQGIGGASPDMLISILPFVLIFVIMYFLIIRPQRTQLKKRGEMLAAIRRGDTVVTGGGLVGKVTKVIDDNELEVDLGGGNKVTALRSTISDVRVKGEPVANQNAKK